MVTRTPAALSTISVLKEKRDRGAGARHVFPLARNGSLSGSSCPDGSRYLTWVTWPSLAAREAGKEGEGTVRLIGLSIGIRGDLKNIEIPVTRGKGKEMDFLSEARSLTPL